MKAFINNKEIALKKTNDTWFPAGMEETVLQWKAENILLIRTPEKIYEMQLLELNKTEKTVTLLYDNRKVTVSIKAPLDDLLHEMGLDKPLSSKVKQVKAPMPGLVLGIHVKPGDAVQKDDKLLLLEAMKMENVIKSPGEGIVAKILVDKGEAVDKNQVLIEFE